MTMEKQLFRRYISYEALGDFPASHVGFRGCISFLFRCLLHWNFGGSQGWWFLMELRLAMVSLSSFFLDQGSEHMEIEKLDLYYRILCVCK